MTNTAPSFEAHVVDFKMMEGVGDPHANIDLPWREPSLQVRHYAKAAGVLGENAATGSIHLLKDNECVDVPIDGAAVAAAIRYVEWAAQGILPKDQTMSLSIEKCSK